LIAAGLAAPINAVPKYKFDPSTVRLDPRLEIKLWASEPDVIDPVAMCFDERGVAYVAECRDYPNGVGPDGKVGSAVRRLEDTDGDGIPDKVSVFASGLSFVTSVTPWRDGILVAAPPDLLFLKDSNGDGLADVREVVLTGFNRGVSDSLVNGLRFHFDNRIHAANGGNGGVIYSPKHPETKLDIQGSDFAFNPDTGECERTWQSGGGFGLVFDDWGRSFVTYNINHIQHRYIPWKHAGMYPGFPPEDLTASISDHEEMSRIFPISAPQTRPNHPEQSGYFSAAGGMGYLSSPAFPEDLRGSVFVGDVVGNLVHREVITSEGSALRASRAGNETDREFLASTDPAFRPVGLEVGPDDALYLLDMQRDTIEHPDYIPAKVKTKLNLRAGDDRGRIYRITPKGGLKPVRPNLQKGRPEELLPYLGYTNAWWRLTAQRLIVERNLKTLAPQLRSLAASSDNALMRLHAAWTLKGMGVLEETDVVRALADAHPRIRENGLQLAENFLPDSAALARPVTRLTADPDGRVRFQAALTLGLIDSDSTTAALQDLYRSESGSPWMRLAILSSLSPTAVRTLLYRFPMEQSFRFARNSSHVQILRDLAALMGAREKGNGEDIGWLLGHVDASLLPAARFAILDGLAAGLDRSGAKPPNSNPVRQALTRVSVGTGPEEARAVWRLARWLQVTPTRSMQQAIDRAILAATNQTLPSSKRLEQIALLEFGVSTNVAPLLFSLFTSSETPEIQEAALRTVVLFDDPAVGRGLVEHWSEYMPALRLPVIRALVDRKSYQAALVEGLETSKLTVGELNLDLEQRRRLLRRADPAVQQRAAKFIHDEEYSNRKTVVDDWLGRLPASGNAAHGQKLFEEMCSRCHRAHDVGRRVGPELDSMSSRSAEDVLSNILDPNMAINPGFITYTIETQDGETHTGLLAAQSAESVTLLQADEAKTVLPRKNIVKMRSTGMSLMPEGLEAGRSPQDMRDIIAFVRGEK
jgi:putative membrane-bound dehydrogenase-like protein